MPDVRTGADPTKALLSQSGLYQKGLCDYVLNVATGCAHGCRFCYVPDTPNIRARGYMLAEHADVEDGQREWGEYVLYRDHLPAKLPGHVERKRKWPLSTKGRGIVGMSFHTDCYMDERAAMLATQCARILTDRDRHVRILTRNPLLAHSHPIRYDPAGRVTLRGGEALANAGDHLTVGSSINSLNESEIAAIEPNAPPVRARLLGLRRLAGEGIQTYVSMSPTYPTLGRDDLEELLRAVAAVNPSVIFHEPINPKGDNFEMTVAAAEAAGEDDLAHALTEIQSPSAWAEYAVRHYRWVQEIAGVFDLPVHLWPDTDLFSIVDAETEAWLRAWYDRQPPEDFAGRPVPDEPMPEPPAPQTTLADVGGGR